MKEGRTDFDRHFGSATLWVQGQVRSDTCGGVNIVVDKVEEIGGN